MMCRGSTKWGVALIAALTSACTADDRPAEETAQLEEASTAIDPSDLADASVSDMDVGPVPDSGSKISPTVAPTPQCTGQSVSNTRRIIILAGSELLTNRQDSSDVDETRFHGTVTEIGSEVPADVDRTVADIARNDSQGWQFARIENDADEPWTILVQGLDDASFGVVANTVVDLRLRYAIYPFAPNVLELVILDDTVPVFYYANVGETFQLSPPLGLTVRPAQVECMVSAECFPMIEFYSLRIAVPGDLSATLQTGESAQLGDYILKHYGTAYAAHSTCIDAFVAHTELVVSRSL
jgi:hypothetical protein